MKLRIRYRNNTGQLTTGFVRFFSISVTVLAMTTVALLSALITLRLAIHIGEVEVPSVNGMTVDDAADIAAKRKLNLTVENRFYSTTVPAGLVISQSPAPGDRVRKLWHMRVTQSMGPQRIPIPDVVGQNERDAEAAIRRASLEVGTIAHLATDGPSGVVLAQTPPANAEGVDKPEVSLLVSQPMSAAPKPYVMPDLAGLSFSAASAKVKELNAHLTATVPQAATAAVGADGVAPAPVILQPAGVVVSQTPAAGSRVFPTDTLHVHMSAGAVSRSSATAVASAAAPAGVAPVAASTTTAAPKPAAPAAAKPVTPRAATP